MSHAANHVQAIPPFREGKQVRAGKVGVRHYHARYLAGPEALTWTVAIFGLCTLDAVCTLIHVGRGATELNPLMNMLLAVSPGVFLCGKLCISAASLFVLCRLLPRVRAGRSCFSAVGGFYFAVCCYHMLGFVW